MSKRALVTGGAGFIGSSLAKRLFKEGWIVDIVDDLSSGRLDLLEGLEHTVFLIDKDYEVAQKAYEFANGPNRVLRASKMPGKRDYTGLGIYLGDFASDVVLDNIKEGNYDFVFHEAAIPRVAFSVENPELTTDVNIGGTVKLLKACAEKTANIKRVVFASSSSIYGDNKELPTEERFSKGATQKSPYALQKSVCESYCRLFWDLYELDTVCLRYFNVFGPGQYAGSPYSTAVSAWCHAIKNGQPLRSDGDGSQTRDMTYIDNVVDANILAANYEGTLKGEGFNVACGSRVSNREILNFLIDVFKDRVTVVDAPWRKGDVKDTLADLTKIKAVLGYEPKVEFWDALVKTCNWWKLSE